MSKSNFEEIMFELSAWDTLLYTILIITVMFLLSKLLTEPPPAVKIRDNKNGHKWSYTDFIINFPLHCNACETLLLTSTGQCCTVCGVAACSTAKCIRTVDRKVPCKAVSRCKTVEEAKVKCSQLPKHRWVNGNLPLDSCCEICDEPAGHGPGLRDMRCIWCQVCVHEECQTETGDRCNYGKHRKVIVPPETVISKQGRTVSSPRRRVISQVISSSSEAGSTPLVIVGNNKSGNSDCAAILAGFRRHLNPAQVINLGESSMEDALEWCTLVKPRKCIIVACGGDGTVSWLLNTVDKMKLSHTPVLAIFPLGTGNDLARALGYGSGSDASADIDQFLTSIGKIDNKI